MKTLRMRQLSHWMLTAATCARVHTAVRSWAQSTSQGAREGVPGRGRAGRAVAGAIPSCAFCSCNSSLLFRQNGLRWLQRQLPAHLGDPGHRGPPGQNLPGGAHPRGEEEEAVRTVMADPWQRTLVGGLAPQSLPSGCPERPGVQLGPGKDAEAPVPPPAPLVSTAAPGSAGRCRDLIFPAASWVLLTWEWGEAWLAVSRDEGWGAGSLPSPHAPSTHIRGQM